MSLVELVQSFGSNKLMPEARLHEGDFHKVLADLRVRRLYFQFTRLPPEEASLRAKKMFERWLTTHGALVHAARVNIPYGEVISDRVCSSYHAVELPLS